MARAFNNIGDYIQNAAFPAFASGNPPAAGTISIWLNPGFSSGDGSNRVMWWVGDATEEAPGLQRFTNNKVYTGFNTSISGDQRIPGFADAGLFVNGTYAQHLFLWGPGPIQSYYIDGLLIASNGIVSSNPTASNGFFVGNSADLGEFCGSAIADFAIWNTVLSGPDIAALATGVRPNKTAAAANLMCWLPLGGTQSPEPDLSGNGFNGTVNGAVFAPDPPQLQPMGGSIVRSSPFIITPGKLKSF